MEKRITLTLLSCLAGLLIFAGIALPVSSYRSYRIASQADFFVKVEAQVVDISVAKAEALSDGPTETTLFAPVLHLEYTAPGEKTARTGERMIPYSKYWSDKEEKARESGLELHPLESRFEIFLSQKDPGQWALEASEKPYKTYKLLTPIGIFISLFGCVLLSIRIKLKKNLPDPNTATKSHSL